jgi:K+-transporting ATPase KdpF subunit
VERERAPSQGDEPVSVLTILGGLIALGLLVYLTYALVRPEKF